MLKQLTLLIFVTAFSLSCAKEKTIKNENSAAFILFVRNTIGHRIRDYRGRHCTYWQAGGNFSASKTAFSEHHRGNISATSCSFGFRWTDLRFCADNYRAKQEPGPN